MTVKLIKYSFLPALITLFMFGCASGSVKSSGVTLDQEWQLGNQMAAQVAQKYHLSHDAEALAYVRNMGEKIHAQTPLAGRPFDFEIVEDPAVNAFSIPGGHVYINSGLIAQADHANELAGVLAHETSHIVARHVIKQIEQQQQIQVIGSILLGNNPGALQQVLAQVLAGGVMARFSRADEKEADDLGLGFMSRAGYDPQGMLDMFFKLQSLEKGQPGAVQQFFADHPMTAERIKDIQKRLASLPRGGVVDDPEYQRIRSRF